MNMKITLATALLGSALLSAPISMAGNLGDEYDPYVLNHEIDAVPSSAMDARSHLGDRHDPYVIVNEVSIAKGCEDPVHERLSDTYNPFVVASDLISSSSTMRC